MPLLVFSLRPDAMGKISRFPLLLFPVQILARPLRQTGC